MLPKTFVKVMNKINVYRKRCAGMCGVHSLITLYVRGQKGANEWHDRGCEWLHCQEVRFPWRRGRDVRTC